jgi:hypothetical protein
MKPSEKGPTLDQVIGSLPLAQRRAVARRKSQLIEEETSLRELRRALGLTQVQVARGLNKGQHEISRMEQRGDMLLSQSVSLERADRGSERARRRRAIIVKILCTFQLKRLQLRHRITA